MDPENSGRSGIQLWVDSRDCAICTCPMFHTSNRRSETQRTLSQSCPKSYLERWTLNQRKYPNIHWSQRSERQKAHPLQQAHLLEVWAGVGQSLQSMGQVKVSAEVEAICIQHIVNHGHESLILLRLEGEKKKTTFTNFRQCTIQNA